MDKRYKILFTVSELMYSSQVRNLYDICSLIDRNIFDVEIGALQTGDDAAEYIRSLGFPVFQFRLQPTRPLRVRDFYVFAKSPFVLARKRYHLVHSLLYQSFFTEALFAKFLGGAKYVYTKSNLEWGNHPFHWKTKSSLADGIISISNATDELLKKNSFHAKSEKIFLGIDTDAFVRSDEKRASFRGRLGIGDGVLVYGCAAQLVEGKEHFTLIDAFERVAARHDQVFLAFCGFHHVDSYFKDFSERLGNSPFAKSMVYLGTERDMQSFYSGIDCFVLPSRNEAFGYVYTEAMSCSLPVIACREAGPLEIVIEGETGGLVNLSDPADLAEKMQEYVTKPDMLLGHGAKARARAVEVFSKHRMVEKTQNLYLRILTN